MEGGTNAHVHVAKCATALKVGVVPVVRGTCNGDRGGLVDLHVRILPWLVVMVVDGLDDGSEFLAAKENDAISASNVSMDRAKDSLPVFDCLLSATLD